MKPDKSRPAQMRFLGDYLCDERSTELFIVGPFPDSLLQRSASGMSIHRLDTLDTAQTLARSSGEGDSVRALVLALDPCEPQFEQRLGCAVRAFPHRVLLHCATTKTEPGRGDEAFYAFGFRKLSVIQDGDDPDVIVKWFEYRLSQYKPAPDWLNAQFWANPERFDKDDDLDQYYEDDEEE